MNSKLTLLKRAYCKAVWHQPDCLVVPKLLAGCGNLDAIWQTPNFLSSAACVRWLACCWWLCSDLSVILGWPMDCQVYFEVISNLNIFIRFHGMAFFWENYQILSLKKSPSMEGKKFKANFWHTPNCISTAIGRANIAETSLCRSCTTRAAALAFSIQRSVHSPWFNLEPTKMQVRNPYQNKVLGFSEAEHAGTCTTA